MKKSIINLIFTYVFVGIGIGAAIVTPITVLQAGMSPALKAIVVWLVASAVIGLVSLIFEVESLSQLSAIVIHAVCTLCTALVAGTLLDYGDGSFPLLLTRMLPVIIILYAAIHLVFFLIRRDTVHSINDKLSNK